MELMKTIQLFVKNHQKLEKQFRHGDYIIFDDYENNVAYCLEVSDARLAEQDDKSLINGCIRLDNCSFDVASGSLIVNGPKFKYGDWLRCGTECGYITYIDNDFYVLSCNGVEKNISFKDALSYDQIHGNMNPFTRVLVRNSLEERWTIAHFAKFVDGLYIVENGRKCRYCVPYCNKTKQYIDTKYNIDYFDYVEPASSYVMKR